MGARSSAKGLISALGTLWATAALLVAGATSQLQAQGDPVRVTFLDVGQGDAVLIQAPEGRTALIDAGPGVELVPRLRRLGVDTLDLVIASHPHADHIGGMRQILRAFPVRFYMDNGRPHTTTTYAGVMDELRARPEIVYLQATPRRIAMGSAALHVLPLPPRSSSNLNNASVGVVLEHGDFVGFFSGDSERPELMHFLREDVVPDVTLLKAPHHGSDDAVSELFMDAAEPEIVVISVGWANRYGHPTAAALRAYRARADHLLRTDMHGRVAVVGYPDGRYEIERGGTVAERGRGESSRPVDTPVEAAGERPAEAEAAPETLDVALRVVADAPGNDHQNPNGEYAIIQNGGASPLAIGGWTLCDLARHCFTFPTGTEIAPRGSVILFTGTGRSAGGQLFWGSGSAIWNNRGDTATLYDARGRIVAIHSY